ncbi:hypothetical protein L1049_011953 [Liquidambar formosana]|uniref:DED domain-containing protein n=1 Tax=Liquidambar formosana TaxID=63359 RepID=A0AAP0X2R9_LIQFO
MAEVLVGKAFLSAALKVLFDRMASREVLDFFKRRNLRDDLLKKLKIILLPVTAVLDDAEEKQITNPAVKKWLNELKDAVYHAEDLLDEIATEALQRNLEAGSRSSVTQVRDFISTSINPFDKGIKSKIKKIIENIEFIAKQKDLLGLKEGVGGKPLRSLPSTSVVDESSIYGRDDDKEKVAKLLLSDDASGNGICVIPIVGMGGIGKTTLTQLLYNDEKVNEYFDLKAWVYVSEEFDVVHVTKAVLQSIDSQPCVNKDLNLLQVKLKEKLMGKKFLLVLDDIWNEKYNDWDTLLTPFKVGAKGSKIIVTTRNESVALIVQTIPSHNLEQLSNEASWSLFTNHAFENRSPNAHPDLEVFGKKIVEKCKGLPLAVKTLGGLLHSKLDAKEWDDILKSNIWDFPNDKSNILPALRLSYHYLPTQLKQCFAYCSLFPKDYKFKKENLVLQWIAEGFVQQLESEKRLEDLAEEYFLELLSRSFFQQSKDEESSFIMHDLLNDLAQVLSNKVLHDLLPTLSCLRVLSLSQYENITELLDSIGKLKLLRYLDLSQTAIKRLPKETCTLYNLQTLMLSDCRSLIELPADIGKLHNLRHLDISGTNLSMMPVEMSGLKSLQTLTTFVVGKQIVGKQNALRVGELREFQHLRGKLSILKLQNVLDATDASEANLKDKKYLDELLLKGGFSDTNDSRNEDQRDIFDKLQPSTNLKKLTIQYYAARSFPNWLGDSSFCNVAVLLLSDCLYCSSLPPLGQLRSLEELYIVRMNLIERVGLEFYGTGLSLSEPFQRLKILRFEEMLKWEEWSSLEGRVFPSLKVLVIRNCPKLKGHLPTHLPSLEELGICGCQQLMASIPRNMTSIRNLQLRGCEEVVLNITSLEHLETNEFPDMTSLSEKMPSLLNTLTSLKYLFIDGCRSLLSFLETGLPSMLEFLKIERCDALESLPEGMFHGCTRFLELRIIECPSLKSFPRGTVPTTSKILIIKKCKKLELVLPEAEETMHNYYASLESLAITSSCDPLKSFPLGLLPKLNYFKIKDCINLESLWIPPDALHDDLPSLSVAAAIHSYPS